MKTFLILFLIGILVSCASLREDSTLEELIDHESNNK
jgi:hypothetical protein